MKKELTKIELTKHIASALFVIYFCLLPFWIYYATWYQLIVGYLCYWFMQDIVQSLFMHRWASHKFWNPPKWVQKILSSIAVVGLIGTPITYAAWHRTHHAFSDTDKDPHSPSLQGWFHVVFAHYHTAEVKRATDRMRDSYFVWLTKNMMSLMILGNLAVFILLPFTWFMTVWAIPVAYTIFNTNFGVLVLSHKSGKPENLSVWALPLLYDDGVFHKSHHDNPKLSQSKYDVSGWIVTKLGWTNEKIS